MNNGQIANLIVFLVTGVFGAIITKLGFDPSKIADSAVQVGLLIAAVFTAWKAHQFHGNNPPSASVPPSPVPAPTKLGIFLVLGLCSAVLVGCSTPAQNVAYQTIGSVEAAGKSSYEGYCILVINGTISTNSVPQVASAYNQLQADALMAATIASQGTNALAPESLIADASNLGAVITTAKNIK